MKMKKNFCLILIILFTFVLIGCKKDKVSIGILIYNKEDIALQEIEQSLVERINSEYELIIKYASGSQSIQNEQFIELLEKKVDIILVDLVDRLVAKAFIEKCNDAKIKLLFFDREPLLDDLLLGTDVYYVGPDSKGFGRLQAKMLKELSGSFIDPLIAVDKNNDSIIQIAIMKGEQGHQLTEYISETCISEIMLKEYKIQVLTTEFTDWKRETAKVKMEKIYKKYGDNIEVLIANSDDLAMGVIDFIHENKLEIYSSNGKAFMPFEIIGANATDESITEINKGYIYGSVINDHETQVDVIIRIIEYLLGNINCSTINECVKEFKEEVIVEKERFIYISGKEISKKTIKNN